MFIKLPDIKYLYNAIELVLSDISQMIEVVLEGSVIGTTGCLGKIQTSDYKAISGWNGRWILVSSALVPVSIGQDSHSLRFYARKAA